MTKKSKTPSRKRQKIVEVVEEKDQEDEDVDRIRSSSVPRKPNIPLDGTNVRSTRRRNAFTSFVIPLLPRINMMTLSRTKKNYSDQKNDNNQWALF